MNKITNLSITEGLAECLKNLGYCAPSQGRVYHSFPQEGVMRTAAVRKDHVSIWAWGPRSRCVAGVLSWTQDLDLTVQEPSGPDPEIRTLYRAVRDLTRPPIPVSPLPAPEVFFLRARREEGQWFAAQGDLRIPIEPPEYCLEGDALEVRVKNGQALEVCYR